MKKTEIIEETVKFYKNHPRGLQYSDTENNPKCVYFSRDNNSMCAIGRVMLDPHKLEGVDETFSDLVWRDFITQLDLQESYRGHHFSFWQDLQGFHDNSTHWIDSDEGWELSVLGGKQLLILMERYSEENEPSPKLRTSFLFTSEKPEKPEHFSY